MIDFFVDPRFAHVVGIITVFLCAYLFSNNRKAINYRLIGAAGVLHVAIGLVVLRTAGGQWVMSRIADGVRSLYTIAEEGIRFVFGSLGTPQEPWGFVFGFHVLPIVIFFGALMGVLFHYSIIQYVVTAVERLLRPILGTSGGETLCAIANSFLGQTEAPLLIRHYITDMTESELMVVMVSGMGTISGSILAIYAQLVPAEHLLTASVMAIPATIMMAKILYPETKKPKKIDAIHTKAIESDNVLDAIASGTSDGLQLALNVGAMLIAFLSLIALINACLSGAGNTVAKYIPAAEIIVPYLSIEKILGILFAPFAWMLGLHGDEIMKAGQLIGIKVAVNEMVAFTTLTTMKLSDRAVILLTYALCGFSNLSCIGIQIGGIGALAPSVRPLLSKLGLRAVVGAVLANLLSAYVAGLLIP